MSTLTVASRACRFCLFALVVGLFGAEPLLGQTPANLTLLNPRLFTVVPAGGQAGKTAEVVVTGMDLDEAKQLHFSHSGISAQLKMADPGLAQVGPQPVYGTFQVTIAAEVPPGIYELRVRGKYGLSNPRAFVVGNLPEIKETEPNNTPKQANEVAVGTTINGTADGRALDYFKFRAEKGQRIIIDCWAYRIDSRLDGTLVLYDSDGTELERNHNTNRRDPLIDFSVPADGEYLVSLHDHMYCYYGTPAECNYRLTISTAPYIDFIYPPADLPGSNRQYTLYGRNLPGGKPAPGVEVDGKQLESLTVTIPLPADKARDLVRGGGLYVEPSESFMDGVAYRLKSAAGVSNPLFLSMATAPIVESMPGKTPLLQPPCEYVGQFWPRGRRDAVTFNAKKGEAYCIEVMSQRLGLPTDPEILVQQIKRDAQGAEQVVDIATVDDDLVNTERVHWSLLGSVLYSVYTHDPSYRLVAPEDGIYRVTVYDHAKPALDVVHAAKGDPRRVYRLAIRKPTPDFRLVALSRPPTNLPLEHAGQQTIWVPVLRPGATELLDVHVERRDGFDGEIQVTADNLPPGVTALPIILAPKQNSAMLVLRAGDNAPAGMSAISVKGKARIGAADAERSARYATMMWEVQATGVTYHRSRLTDQILVSVIPSEPAPFSLVVDPEAKLEASLAGTTQFPIKAVRRGNFKGALELFVYGLPPTSNGPMHAQPKYHTPITLAANQESIEFKITVPNYTPPGTYSFFISGLGTVNFARDPEKLKAAEARLAAIEKIVADNDVKFKAAVAAQAAAAKAVTDAQAAKKDNKAALAAKAAADKAVADADYKAKTDAALLTTFRPEVEKIRNEHKPVDLKVSAVSNRMTLKMTPTPFEFQSPPASVAVKQGAKIEVPLTFKRLYGYADAINAHWHGVYSMGGINAPVLTIPAGQSAGKLVIEAIGAAPGTYTFPIVASATYNGQPLSLKHDLTVTIEPAAPAKK